MVILQGCRLFITLTLHICSAVSSPTSALIPSNSCRIFIYTGAEVVYTYSSTQASQYFNTLVLIQVTKPVYKLVLLKATEVTWVLFLNFNL